MIKEAPSRAKVREGAILERAVEEQWGTMFLETRLRN
jgi:hypothetical protein